MLAAVGGLAYTLAALLRMQIYPPALLMVVVFMNGKPNPMSTHS